MAEANKRDVLNRLSRLEGQIRGVKKMIEEEVECEKIVGQLSACHSALEGATKLVVVHYFGECLEESRKRGEKEEEAFRRLLSLLLNTKF